MGATLKDHELLEQIAACCGDATLEELRECLRLANEVFCGRRLSKKDREYAEALLLRAPKERTT